MNGSKENGILQRVPEFSRPRIEALDDSHRKLQKQEHLEHLRILSLSGILVILVNLAYFVYRIILSFSDVSHSSLLEVLIMWTFLGLELGLAGPSIMLSIVTLLEYTKLRIRPSLRLIGNQVPTVDVLIPCCGENLDTILNTVRAACALDYPEQKFRVVILDDGDSADLKERIDQLRETKENLFYAIRGVKVEGHSKAANLNHGLRFVDMRGSSEYIAVLDVDMIPMTNFLRALIPHLLDKPEFAMAASPQSFYNIPDGDPLGQSLHIGFDILLFLGESKHGTLCPGSGFVVRRSAIDAIGGFPTDNPMEDVMTSLLFWQKRWKIAYVWERLQWGTVPETYAGHALQATKWTQGLVSITGTSLLGPRLPLLTKNHCFRVIFIFIGFLGPVVFLGFAMVFIPLVLLSKKPFIMATPVRLQHLLILSSLQLIATWINGFATAAAVRSQTTFWPPYRHSYLAFFQSIAILELISPLQLNRDFLTSGSAQHAWRERKARESKSLIWRVMLSMRQPSSWFYLSIISSIVSGAILHLKDTLDQKNFGSWPQQQKLFTSLAWPSVFAHSILFVWDCWRPLSYAIFPPKIHTKETLLEQDPETKVGYPSKMALDEERIRSSKGLSLVVLAYAVFVLVYAWRTDVT